MASTDEGIAHKRPRMSPLARYNSRLRDWISSTSVKDLELFRSHRFGNSHSLSNIVINPDLIENIVDKWGTKNRVFKFDMIKVIPTIKEYTRFDRCPTRTRASHYSLSQVKF